MLEIGSRLGPYVVLSPLGTGGMGVVFRARDTKLNRDVALKILSQHLADDPLALARFEREAHAVAALSHPNILAIHDYGRIDDHAFAVMELLEGETLRERLASGPVPVRKAIEFAVQIATGLAAAHERGIVHRDLKPDNVFVTQDGRLKILDFGLALHAPVDNTPDDQTVTRRTHPGAVLGTVGYMSPEQVRGLPVDSRSDIFSFGVIAYEMLAGERPFRGSTPADTMSAILNEEPLPIAASGRAVPISLERLVFHCLEKRREERFRSAHDLVLSLGAATTDTSRTSSGSGLPALPVRRRLPWPLLAAAAGGLLLGVSGGWLLTRDGGAAPAGPSIRLTVPGVDFNELTWSGRDFSPAASPDERKIAFRSERSGAPCIWVKQVGGEDELQITRGPDDDFPRFSPDGTQLLFVRTEPGRRGEPGRRSLYRLPDIGGVEPRRVIEDALEADWQPDGRHVVFVRDVEQQDGEMVSHILSVSLDGSEQRELARLGYRVEHPRVSPDGRSVALIPVPGSRSLPVGAAQAVHVLSTETGETRRVPAPERRRLLSAAAWASPREIVYAQADSVVNAAGSEALILRQDVETGRLLESTWSPARPLVLDILGRGRVVFDARSARQNIREEVLDVGRSRGLTRGSSTDRQPAFSPDGEWVIFSSNREGQLDLWKISTRTGREQRLTRDDTDDWDPAFTPSGGIVWSCGRDGRFEVWAAEGDGSGKHRITSDGVSADNPTLTPDGQWIVHASGNPEKTGVWKVRPDGSEATHILAGSAHMPEVSPDGRHSLYRVQAAADLALIRVIGLDGVRVAFEIRVEYRRLTRNLLGRARWMPDGRAIAFIGQDERGVAGIFVQDFAPGRDTSATRRKLTGFDPEIATESFGLSPDGRRIVISGWVQQFSLMEARGLPGLLPTRYRGGR
jgi:serine/threonine protein kinase/Tol biopolymer transport system component